MDKELLSTLYALYIRHPRISTDTRSVKEDSLFFSLKGDRFNANAFAAEALEKGCRYAIIDDAGYRKDKRYLLVPDALKALQDLARFHRSQMKIPVLGITGSNGKTTTKELTAAVLSKKYRITCTEGNLNNHIGVPLTVLSITSDRELAIIEMGANHVGEIAFLCNIAKPTHGIITNIGKAHLEGFGGPEGVIRAKRELYEHLQGTGGTAFVNAGDSLLMKESSSLQRYTYGNENADINGMLLSADPFVRFHWKKKAASGENEVRSKLAGGYNISNLLASVAAGVFFGVPDTEINNALETYEPSMSRSQVIRKGSITILLDAYNANPTSMRSAIENFFQMRAEKKALILGDMLELGEYAGAEHQSIVNLLEEKGLRNIVLIGKNFNSCSIEAGTERYITTEDAANDIKKKSYAGYSVLIKGSRGIKLENLLEFIRE